MLQLQSAFGVLALLALAWGFGENRGAVSLRQAAIALPSLRCSRSTHKMPFVAHAFGVSMMPSVPFGGLARGHGLRIRLSRRRRAAVRFKSAGRGFILAFQALPVVLVMKRIDHAAVLLAHPAPVVRGMGGCGAHARGRRRGRASTAANIFLGMVEHLCSSGLIFRS